ncbi:MAG: catalase [Rhodobacteraceae bacterium]|nr:catalase [Paracoccaceae bacterium]
MNDDSLSRALVDAIIANSDDHDPNKRPIHTVGIGVEGHFRALKAATRYCTEEHSQGQEVKATAGFSNGSGSHKENDGALDIRGMATRFHLQNDHAADILAMTLNVFFCPRHPKLFQIHQKGPGVTRNRLVKDPGFSADEDPDPEDPRSNVKDLIEFANAHPEAMAAVTTLGTIGAPVSYARASYHAVNTFVAVDPEGGQRQVRFHWQPLAGVLNTKSQRSHRQRLPQGRTQKPPGSLARPLHSQHDHR